MGVAECLVSFEYFLFFLFLFGGLLLGDREREREREREGESGSAREVIGKGIAES